MKKGKCKLLAAMVALAMLCFCMPVFAEDTTGSVVAQFTEASFYSVDSYTVGGTDRGACYVIDLKTDQSIFLSNGYWDRNLQQNGGGCSEEHAARANVLRQNIWINGVTVDADLVAGTDHSNSTMISTVSPSTLRIHIRKAENHYGLTDTGDFMLEIGSGITLNGIALSPVVVQYTAATGSFTIENGKMIARSAETYLEEASAPCPNKEHVGEQQWVVRIRFDRNIFPDDGVANYYRNHLSVTAATCSDGKSTVGAALRKAILINGKDLDTCIAEDGTNEYEAVHVQVVKGGAYRFLRIVIPKTNRYGFDGKNFEITIKEGIMLNGYTLQPFKLVYPEPLTAVVNEGKSAAAVAEDGSSALRFGFTLSCDGVTYEDATHGGGNYRRDMSAARMTVSGTEYTLVDFGAIVSIQTGDNLTLATVDNHKTKLVPAVNLYRVGEDGTVSYTAKIIEIPDTQFGRTVYARAYVTLSDGENQWTLYGDTVEGCVQELLSTE